MSFKLPPLYPLTDTRLSGLSHVEQVEQFIAGGAMFIQLREKYAAPDEFFAEAEKAIAVAHQAGAKIIVNDRVDIALAVNADGVHLGQDDLPPAEARKLLGDKAIIGYSTHNIAQVVQALTLPIDYFAFGPVFSTTTKENPDPTVGLDKLKKIRHLTSDFPLVAIGGITFENYREVLAAGADSVAVVSALFSGSKSPIAQVKRFLSLT